LLCRRRRLLLLLLLPLQLLLYGETVAG